MRGEGKVSLHAQKPTNLQHLGNLLSHQPGRQMMRITNDIHVIARIVVEADIFRLAN